VLLHGTAYAGSLKDLIYLCFVYALDILQLLSLHPHQTAHRKKTCHLELKQI
jgi:hypothetical protein